MTAFACPACGFAQHQSNTKCLKCGVQLNEPVAIDDAPPAKPPLSKEAWRALGIGLVLALVFMKLPFMGMLFHPLITIVHELGHTVTGWLFGYPSIPAFDFGEGGGATFHFNTEQDVLGPILVYVIFAVLLWKTRRHPPTTYGLLVIAAVYTFIAFSHWHRAVILVAGEGAVVLMSSVFLNRAMTGTKLLQADERPAYAMVGFIMLFHEFAFFWQLANDASFRDWYDTGKSYADNDLVVLLDEHVHSSLIGLANIGMLCCVAAVVLARLAYRYEGVIEMWPSRAFGSGESVG